MKTTRIFSNSRAFCWCGRSPHWLRNVLHTRQIRNQSFIQRTGADAVRSHFFRSLLFYFRGFADRLLFWVHIRTLRVEPVGGASKTSRLFMITSSPICRKFGTPLFLVEFVESAFEPNRALCHNVRARTCVWSRAGSLHKTLLSMCRTSSCAGRLVFSSIF